MVSIARGRHAPTTGRRPPRVGAMRMSVRVICGATAAVVAAVAGGDRYGTAAAVSQATFSQGVALAFLATGADSPDALSGGAAAASAGGPVLLVTHDTMPQTTVGELQRLQPKAIIVLGGPDAVSDVVVQQARSFTTGPVTRAQGGDRYDTSAPPSAT